MHMVQSLRRSVAILQRPPWALLGHLRSGYIERSIERTAHPRKAKILSLPTSSVGFSLKQVGFQRNRVCGGAQKCG